jgi:nicotinamide-nucleotide amidase
LRDLQHFMSVLEPIKKLVQRLEDLRIYLVTAESLTGGLIGASITEIPGSSAVYWGGIISYTIEAKTRLLGVSPATIDRYGVVSSETAESMACGALAVSGVDISIAVTGVAGPGGGTDRTPVGTVCIAVAIKNPGLTAPSVKSARFRFSGSRADVREQTVREAASLAIYCLDSV